MIKAITTNTLNPGTFGDTHALSCAKSRSMSASALNAPIQAHGM
jgi:hypothetical protein